jgi:hypothetical protein
MRKFLSTIKQKVFSQRLFKLGSFTLLGFMYFKRENIIKYLNEKSGNYLQNYHEKNTELQRILKENLNLPIEVFDYNKFLEHI